MTALHNARTSATVRRPVYYWALRRYVRSVKASMGGRS